MQVRYIFDSSSVTFVTMKRHRERKKSGRDVFLETDTSRMGMGKEELSRLGPSRFEGRGLEC